MVFPEMCHSCGGCEMVCPEKAVIPSSRVLGQVLRGVSPHGISLTWGLLRVGEAMSPPLIREVTSRIDRGTTALVDAPPGTSCPAVAALRGADFALLVTEPTPFGLNDLSLTVDALKAMGIPMGIVINRDDGVPGIIDAFAASENIPILQRLPFSREAAAVSSRGGLLVEGVPGMRSLFGELLVRLMECVSQRALQGVLP
jgi:MinD superfamily P-loop ATPase